ncbi:MAG TPA: SDR family oxidoreductase [Anaerolineae bacterium]|jgi:3-oxoacyl-[acyl-carrier protein] reductase
MLLNDKVALVTGAAGNVGRGLVKGLARHGAHVIMNDINAEGLETLAAECRTQGWSVSPALADLCDGEAMQAVVDRAVADHGSLDILVNNAIIYPHKGEEGPFLTITAAGWREFMSRNMDALFFTTHAATRVMARQRRGSILNMSSNGAILAHRQLIAYDALKGAVDAYTRALAVDLAPWQIRVNALRPVMITDPAPPGSEQEALLDRLGAQIPMGRVARPADAAWACVFLSADEAEFITGQIINIDGGMLEQSRPPELELKPAVGPDDIEL